MLAKICYQNAIKIYTQAIKIDTSQPNSSAVCDTPISAAAASQTSNSNVYQLCFIDAPSPLLFLDAPSH